MINKKDLGEKTLEFIKDSSATKAALEACRSPMEVESVGKILVQLYSEKYISHLTEVITHLPKGELRSSTILLYQKVSEAFNGPNRIEIDFERAEL